MKEVTVPTSEQSLDHSAVSMVSMCHWDVEMLFPPRHIDGDQIVGFLGRSHLAPEAWSQVQQVWWGGKSSAL
jgi:hypothetical protein